MFLSRLQRMTNSSQVFNHAEDKTHKKWHKNNHISKAESSWRQVFSRAKPDSCFSRVFRLQRPSRTMGDPADTSLRLNVQSCFFFPVFMIFLWDTHLFASIAHPDFTTTPQRALMNDTLSSTRVVTAWLIRELTQPRRRRQQELHKFAYLIMNNNRFARFARAFFIFDISQTFSFFLWLEMTCFAVLRTTWPYHDKSSIFYEALVPI